MFMGTEDPTQFDGPSKTWTSIQKNVDRLDFISGSVLSDQAGTLHVEQSGDGGSHWDIEDTIAVTANTGAKINNISILLPVVRLRFVATSSVPTVFRAYAHLSASGDS